MIPEIAVGEPPHCLSCSALFAVKRAIESAREDGEIFDFFSLGKIESYCLTYSVLSACSQIVDLLQSLDTSIRRYLVGTCSD